MDDGKSEVKGLGDNWQITVVFDGTLPVFKQSPVLILK